MADYPIRVSHTKTTTVWINSEETYPGIATAIVRLSAMEAYCRQLRVQGAADDVEIQAKSPAQNGLSARLTATFPLRESEPVADPDADRQVELAEDARRDEAAERGQR